MDTLDKLDNIEKRIEELKQENQQLKDKIEKAIEYIKIKSNNPIEGMWQEKELLEILKGDSDEK